MGSNTCYIFTRHRLEVYQRVELVQSQDYEKLREELLRRFKLTEGEYREKFKTVEGV